MDPGRPKNQSSHNQTKMTPLCMDLHADSDHIMFSSNGYHMRKLLCFDQIPKHAKSQLVKVNADISNMTSDVNMMS